MKRKVLACPCAMLFLGMDTPTGRIACRYNGINGELDVRFVDLALFGQYDDEPGWAYLTV